MFEDIWTWIISENEARKNETFKESFFDLAYAIIVRRPVYIL